jgi:transcriptional regulator with XRE-family HTH domain
MNEEERAERRREIGLRVRQRRQELGLNQDALASATGLSKSFLSDLENGHTDASGLNHLRIARALKVTVQWLLDGQLGSDPAPTAPAVVAIPPEVADVANEENWPFRLTSDVAQALAAVDQNILARRACGPIGPTARDIVRDLGATLRKRGGYE